MGGGQPGSQGRGALTSGCVWNDPLSPHLHSQVCAQDPCLRQQVQVTKGTNNPGATNRRVDEPDVVSVPQRITPAPNSDTHSTGGPESSYSGKDAGHKGHTL